MGGLTSFVGFLGGILLSYALIAGAQTETVEDGWVPSLQIGFYKNSCPQAEHIVRRTIMKNMLSDLDLPAGLIRLFFHDCFVRVSHLCLYSW